MDLLDLNDAVYGAAPRPDWKQGFQLAVQLSAIANHTALVDQIVDTVIGLAHAERGFLVLREENKNHIVAARHFEQHTIQDPVQELSRTIVERVLQSGAPVILMDATSDHTFGAIDSVRRLQLKSIGCLPLRTVDGTTIGAIYLDNRSINNAFTGESLQILEGVCALAGQILHNRHVLDQLQARTDRLAANCQWLMKDNMSLSQQKTTLEQRVQTLLHSVTEHKPNIKTCLVWALIGLLALTHCGRLSGDYYNGPDLAETPGQAAEPLPIFGDTKSVNLFAAGFLSGGEDIDLEASDITIELAAFTVTTGTSDAALGSASVTKSLISSSDTTTYTFDTPLVVSVMEDGETVSTGFAAIQTGEEAITTIEYEVTRITVTGTLDGVGFEYVSDEQATLPHTETIAIDEETETTNVLLIDFDPIVAAVDTVIEDEHFRHPAQPLLHIQTYNQDLWEKIKDRLTHVIDEDGDGKLDAGVIQSREHAKKRVAAQNRALRLKERAAAAAQPPQREARTATPSALAEAPVVARVAATNPVAPTPAAPARTESTTTPTTTTTTTETTTPTSSTTSTTATSSTTVTTSTTSSTDSTSSSTASSATTSTTTTTTTTESTETAAAPRATPRPTKPARK